MNIPEVIRIGGVDYSIIYKENLNTGGQLALGFCDFDNAKIELASNLQGEQGIKQTFIHEILHAICNHFELELNSDEDSIDKLAKGLYMVIKDNPDLFSRR